MIKHTPLPKAWWDSFLSVSNPRKDYGDVFVWTKQELQLKQKLKDLKNDKRI